MERPLAYWAPRRSLGEVGTQAPCKAVAKHHLRRCFSLGSRLPSWPTNEVVLYVHESGCPKKLGDRLSNHDDVTGRVCPRQSTARSKKTCVRRDTKGKGEPLRHSGKERRVRTAAPGGDGPHADPAGRRNPEIQGDRGIPSPSRYRGGEESRSAWQGTGWPSR